MTALEIIGKKGTDAVKKLRVETLRNGQPFMINSKDLESRQFYYEFPDGIIQLAYLEKGKRDFTMLRELTVAEAQAVRAKYGFSQP